MPTRLIPAWVRRAVRRRQLLLLGVSLTEQNELPARELDELLHVHAVYVDEQNAREEAASKG